MRARVAVLAAALLYGFLLTPLAQAQAPAPVLAAARPEAVGLSGARLGQLSAALKSDIEKGVIPGAMLLVARHGKIAGLRHRRRARPRLQGAHDQGRHLPHLLHEQAHHLRRRP